MGAFSGKIGPVVGATWRGIPYMRVRPSKRTIPAREKEKANRNKFAMAHWWLQPVIEFVRWGFKGYSDRMQGFIAAKSYLLKNAFENNGNGWVINPTLVKLSHGDLPLPKNITINKVAPDLLQFSWDGANVNNGDRCDQAMLLAYDIDDGVAIENTTGQFRSTGADTLQIIPRSPEKTYHVYIAFVAADRSRQSDSVYLGTIAG